MKNLVSVILAVVLVFSTFAVITSAETTHEFQEYELEFVQYLEENWYYPESFDYGYLYKVAYSHFDGEDDATPSWVIIKAYTERLDAGNYGIFGDYVLSSSDGMPYGLGYYYHDVETGEFYRFHEAWEMGLIDMEELIAVPDVFHISILGDIDHDSILSIIDATEIQLCLANLKELETDYFFRFAGSEYGSSIEHIADRNCDGSVDILDATAIQLSLAKLDENDEQMIVKQAQAYNYNNLSEMPEDSTAIWYETLYTYEDFMKYPSTYFENFYDDIYAIVKTKVQYDELLNIHNDKFDEAFFEDKYLVVVVRRTSNLGMLAPAECLSIKGDTLYFTADAYFPAGTEVVQPVESFFTSITAVDKDLLKGITDIERVKAFEEPIENEELVMLYY